MESKSIVPVNVMIGFEPGWQDSSAVLVRAEQLSLNLAENTAS